MNTLCAGRGVSAAVLALALSLGAAACGDKGDGGVCLSGTNTSRS
jgi:hypothetical protein